MRVYLPCTLSALAGLLASADIGPPAAGQPLRTAAAVSAGMAIEIEFTDGRVGARADGALSADQASGDAGKPRGRRGGGAGQGDLF